MTNLPITSNNSPSPARGTLIVATLPAPKPSEGRTSGGAPFTGVRNDSSVAPDNAALTAQPNSAVNDPTAETFSAMLARQIHETDSPTLDTTQISITNDGDAAIVDADPTAKNVQDQTTATTSSSSDPTNSLVAVLLQIPVQQINVSSNATPMIGIPLPSGNLSTSIGQSSDSTPIRGVGGMRQRKDISLLQPSDGSGIDSAFPATINRPQAGSSALITLASDAFKQTGIIARSTGQPQDSQNNIKAVTSALASPLMPTILTSDIPTNIQQTIATPLGNNGWAGEFSQKIIWMSTQQNQIAELHLNPPDLGPLKVVLEISENQLTAQFTSPHSGVRDAVENALPKLRDILADSGIKLGNTTVSDQPSRDRSAEGFMNQGYGSAAQRETSYKATESNGISPTTAQGIPMRRHNGLLDTFA